MEPSNAVGRVLVGTIATVSLSVLTLPLLPVLGIATAEVVGARFSPWLLAVPLGACATVGGAITGALQRGPWTESTMLGGLAAALGSAAIGVVLGGVTLLILWGMTPAHGQEQNLSEGAVTLTALGGGIGFVAGAVCGAVGGVGGYVVRRELAG